MLFLHFSSYESLDYPSAGFPVRLAHLPAPDNARIKTAQPLTSNNQISSDGIHRPEL
jgi:hypothetical protein